MASRGMTEEQIAASLGICRDTLIQKKREFSDFSDAIKKGKAQGVAVVTNKLFERATKGAGNIIAMIFYLKNRAGWTDAHTVKAEQAPSPADMNPEEAQYILTDQQLEQIAAQGMKKVMDHQAKRLAQPKEGD